MPTLEEVCARHGLVAPQGAYPGLVTRIDDVEKPGQQDGFLVLFADGAGGFIQNHRNANTGESFFFGSDRHKMSDQQRNELRRVRDAERKRVEAAREEAALEVWRIWCDWCEPARADHPYLARKGAGAVAPLCRQLRGVPPEARLVAYLPPPVLALPILDWSDRLRSIEYVGADGTRRFHPFGEKSGNFMVLGAEEATRPGPIFVAEGLTTASSVWQATGRPVVVAFDAGNLPKVTEGVRNRFPLARIIVAADDDVALERQQKANKGRVKGMEAAEVGRAGLAVPDFSKMPERGEWSDFNDVHFLMGLEEVARQLNAAPPAPGEPEPWLEDPLPEIGQQFGESDLASAFARLRRPDLRYVAAWKRWMVHRGGVWRREETLGVYDAVGQLCEQVRVTRNVNAPAMRKAATRSAVEKIAQADRRMAATSDQWDRDNWLLNTPGGVVDLRTGAVGPHRPAAYMSMQTRATPGGACPRWLQFIEEITVGSPGLPLYLQRLAGYCATGDTREQALVFFWGTGRNGKGTFIDVLEHVLGDYFGAAAADTFTEARGDRHPADLAALKGKRLVVAQEIEGGKFWAESRIKSLTGQDAITARFMGGDYFTYRPTFKIVIAANNKPRFSAVDAAIRSRLQLVPFLQNFEELGTKDEGLRDKLFREAPGIMRWVVDGALMWRTEGLAPPDAIKSATTDYLDAEDLEARWLEERCVRDPIGAELLTTLFVDWCTFAEKRHGRQKRDRDLGERLEREGFTKTKTPDGLEYRGLRLRDLSDQRAPNVVPFRRF